MISNLQTEKLQGPTQGKRSAEFFSDVTTSHFRMALADGHSGSCKLGSGKARLSELDIEHVPYEIGRQGNVSSTLIPFRCSVGIK